MTSGYVKNLKALWDKNDCAERAEFGVTVKVYRKRLVGEVGEGWD